MLTIIAMAGVIVVFEEDGTGSATVTSGAGGPTPSTDDPVTIPDPSALAPPKGVPRPPTEPGAVLEWTSSQDWSAVLSGYYSSFPIDGLALDPVANGKSSTRGVPTGESHRIIVEGSTGTPALSPYVTIHADPRNPTGSVVSLFIYDS